MSDDKIKKTSLLDEINAEYSKASKKSVEETQFDEYNAYYTSKLDEAKRKAALNKQKKDYDEKSWLGHAWDAVGAFPNTVYGTAADMLSVMFDPNVRGDDRFIRAKVGLEIPMPSVNYGIFPDKGADYDSYKYSNAAQEYLHGIAEEQQKQAYSEYTRDPYRQEEEWRFNDPQWWAEGVSNTAGSALPYMALTGGLGSGAGAAGSAIRASVLGAKLPIWSINTGVKALGKITIDLARLPVQTAAAATSAYIEGKTQAYATYDAAKKAYLEKGMSEDEAGELAAGDARDMALQNTLWNVPLNMFSTGLFMKPSKAASMMGRTATMNVGETAADYLNRIRNLKVGSTWKKGVINAALEMPQEAWEELNTEAAHQHQVKHAKGESQGIMSDWLSTMGSEEGQVSAFWGAIGGATIGPSMSGLSAAKRLGAGAIDAIKSRNDVNEDGTVDRFKDKFKRSLKEAWNRTDDKEHLKNLIKGVEESDQKLQDMLKVTDDTKYFTEQLNQLSEGLKKAEADGDIDAVNQINMAIDKTKEAIFDMAAKHNLKNGTFDQFSNLMNARLADQEATLTDKDEIDAHRNHAKELKNKVEGYRNDWKHAEELTKLAPSITEDAFNAVRNYTNAQRTYVEVDKANTEVEERFINPMDIDGNPTITDVERDDRTEAVRRAKLHAMNAVKTQQEEQLSKEEDRVSKATEEDLEKKPSRVNYYKSQLNETSTNIQDLKNADPKIKDDLRNQNIQILGNSTEVKEIAHAQIAKTSLLQRRNNARRDYEKYKDKEYVHSLGRKAVAKAKTDKIKNKKAKEELLKKLREVDEKEKKSKKYGTTGSAALDGINRLLYDKVYKRRPAFSLWKRNYTNAFAVKEDGTKVRIDADDPGFKLNKEKGVYEIKVDGGHTLTFQEITHFEDENGEIIVDSKAKDTVDSEAEHKNAYEENTTKSKVVATTLTETLSNLLNDDTVSKKLKVLIKALLDSGREIGTTIKMFSTEAELDKYLEINPDKLSKEEIIEVKAGNAVYVQSKNIIIGNVEAISYDKLNFHNVLMEEIIHAYTYYAVKNNLSSSVLTKEIQALHKEAINVVNEHILKADEDSKEGKIRDLMLTYASQFGFKGDFNNFLELYNFLTNSEEFLVFSEEQDHAPLDALYYFKPILYPLTDVDEFIAGIFVSPELGKILSKQTKRQNVFVKFCTFLSKLFKEVFVGDSIEGTVLYDAIYTSLEHIAGKSSITNKNENKFIQDFITYISKVSGVPKDSAEMTYALMSLGKSVQSGKPFNVIDEFINILIELDVDLNKEDTNNAIKGLQHFIKRTKTLNINYKIVSEIINKVVDKQIKSFDKESKRYAHLYKPLEVSEDSVISKFYDQLNEVEFEFYNSLLKINESTAKNKQQTLERAYTKYKEAKNNILKYSTYAVDKVSIVEYLDNIDKEIRSILTSKQKENLKDDVHSLIYEDLIDFLNEEKKSFEYKQEQIRLKRENKERRLKFKARQKDDATENVIEEEILEKEDGADIHKLGLGDLGKRLQDKFGFYYERLGSNAKAMFDDIAFEFHTALSKTKKAPTISVIEFYDKQFYNLIRNLKEEGGKFEITQNGKVNANQSLSKLTEGIKSNYTRGLSELTSKVDGINLGQVASMQQLSSILINTFSRDFYVKFLELLRTTEGGKSAITKSDIDSLMDTIIAVYESERNNFYELFKDADTEEKVLTILRAKIPNKSDSELIKMGEFLAKRAALIDQLDNEYVRNNIILGVYKELATQYKLNFITKGEKDIANVDGIEYAEDSLTIEMADGLDVDGDYFSDGRDAFKNVSTFVRGLLSNVQQNYFFYTEDGTPVPAIIDLNSFYNTSGDNNVVYINPTTGFPDYIDPRGFTNRLYDIASKVTTYEELIAKLEEYAVSDPTIASFLFSMKYLGETTPAIIKEIMTLVNKKPFLITYNIITVNPETGGYESVISKNNDEVGLGQMKSSLQQLFNFSNATISSKVGSFEGQRNDLDWKGFRKFCNDVFGTQLFEENTLNFIFDGSISRQSFERAFDNLNKVFGKDYIWGDVASTKLKTDKATQSKFYNEFVKEFASLDTQLRAKYKEDESALLQDFANMFSLFLEKISRDSKLPISKNILANKSLSVIDTFLDIFAAKDALPNLRNEYEASVHRLYGVINVLPGHTAVIDKAFSDSFQRVAFPFVNRGIAIDYSFLKAVAPDHAHLFLKDGKVDYNILNSIFQGGNFSAMSKLTYSKSDVKSKGLSEITKALKLPEDQKIVSTEVKHSVKFSGGIQGLLKYLQEDAKVKDYGTKGDLSEFVKNHSSLFDALYSLEKVCNTKYATKAANINGKIIQPFQYKDYLAQAFQDAIKDPNIARELYTQHAHSSQSEWLRILSLPLDSKERIEFVKSFNLSYTKGISVRNAPELEMDLQKNTKQDFLSLSVSNMFAFLRYPAKGNVTSYWLFPTMSDKPNKPVLEFKYKFPKIVKNGKLSIDPDGIVELSNIVRAENSRIIEVYELMTSVIEAQLEWQSTKTEESKERFENLKKYLKEGYHYIKEEYDSKTGLFKIGKSNKSDAITNFEKAKDVFTFRGYGMGYMYFPILNKVSNTSFTSSLYTFNTIEGVDIKQRNHRLFNANEDELISIVQTAMKGVVKQMEERTQGLLTIWEQGKVIKKDASGYVFNKFPSNYIANAATRTGLVNPEDIIYYLAFSYEFNNTLNNYELNSMLGNDPAAVIKHKPFKEDTGVAYNESYINNLVASGIELRKRNAGLMAPGERSYWDTKDFLGADRDGLNTTGGTNTHINIITLSDNPIGNGDTKFYDEYCEMVARHKTNLRKGNELVYKEELEKAKKEYLPYKEGDGTDAQGYITLNFFLDEQVSSGAMSVEDAKLIMSTVGLGQPMPKELLAKGIHLSPTKPVSDGYNSEVVTYKDKNGNIVERKVYSRNYLKLACVVLTPALTQGSRDLEALRKTMEANNVGLAVHKTGYKVGFPIHKSKKLSELNEDGDIGYENLHQIPRKFYGIQQNLTPEVKKKINIGTQASRMLFEDLPMDYVLPKFLGKDNVSVSDAYNEYNDLLSKLINLKMNKFKEKFGITENNEILDFEHFHNAVMNSVLADGESTQNLIDSLNIRYSSPDENGEVKALGFAVPLTSSKVQGFLLSLVRREAQLLKLPGTSGVLVSGSPFSKKQVRRLEDIENKDLSNIIWAQSFDPEQGLKPSRIENGKFRGSQIIIPSIYPLKSGGYLDMRNYIDKEKSKEQGRLIFKEDKLPTEIRELFGYRIPTQGRSTMGIFEVVGFLPAEMGSTIIASDFIIAQMGSDNDGDKLYLYTGNYSTFYSEEEKQEVLAEKTKLESVIDALKTVLETKKEYRQIITELTDTVKYLENEKNRIENIISGSLEGNIYIDDTFTYESFESFLNSGLEDLKTELRLLTPFLKKARKTLKEQETLDQSLAKDIPITKSLSRLKDKVLKLESELKQFKRINAAKLSKHSFLINSYKDTIVKTFDGDGVSELENKIIQAYIDVNKSELAFINSLQPLTTEPIKELGKTIGEKSVPKDTFSSEFEIYSFFSNADGKAGVGIFVNASSLKNKAASKDLRFNSNDPAIVDLSKISPQSIRTYDDTPGVYVRRYGHTYIYDRFSDIYLQDKDGKLSDNLNRLVTAATDAAKDPIFFNFNITKDIMFTVGMLASLSNDNNEGLDITFPLLLLKQPLISKMLEYVEDKKSKVSLDKFNFVDVCKEYFGNIIIQYGVPTKYIDARGKEVIFPRLIRDSNAANIFYSFYKSDLLTYKETDSEGKEKAKFSYHRIDMPYVDYEYLENNAKNPIQNYDFNNFIPVSHVLQLQKLQEGKIKKEASIFYSNDIGILYSFIKYIEYTQSYKQFNAVSNQDTSLFYDGGFSGLAQKKKILSKEKLRFFDINDLNSFNEGTFRETQQVEGFDFAYNFYKPMALYGTSLGRSLLTTYKFSNSLVQLETDIWAYIYSEVGFPIRKDDKIIFETPDNVYNLVQGKDSKSIAIGQQFKDIVQNLSKYGLENNEFIKNLKYSTKKANNTFLGFIDFNNSSLYIGGSEDKMTSYFIDLLTHENQDVRDFADNLIALSFLRGAQNSNRSSYHKFIPISYLTQIGFYDKVYNTLHNLDDGTDPVSFINKSNVNRLQIITEEDLKRQYFDIYSNNDKDAMFLSECLIPFIFETESDADIFIASLDNSVLRGRDNKLYIINAILGIWDYDEDTPIIKLRYTPVEFKDLDFTYYRHNITNYFNLENFASNTNSEVYDDLNFEVNEVIDVESFKHTKETFEFLVDNELKGNLPISIPFSSGSKGGHSEMDRRMMLGSDGIIGGDFRKHPIGTKITTTLKGVTTQKVPTGYSSTSIYLDIFKNSNKVVHDVTAENYNPEFSKGNLYFYSGPMVGQARVDITGESRKLSYSEIAILEKNSFNFVLGALQKGNIVAIGKAQGMDLAVRNYLNAFEKNYITYASPDGRFDLFIWVGNEEGKQAHSLFLRNQDKYFQGYPENTRPNYSTEFALPIDKEEVALNEPEIISTDEKTKSIYKYDYGKSARVNDSPDVIDVTTRGDSFGRQFSPFNALIDGVSIEHIYQTKVKGYSTYEEGKGKLPVWWDSTQKDTSKQVLYNEYKKLWLIWAESNPDKMKELAKRAKGNTLIDRFATSENNQAKVLAELLNEYSWEHYSNAPQDVGVQGTLFTEQPIDYTISLNNPNPDIAILHHDATFPIIVNGIQYNSVTDAMINHMQFKESKRNQEEDREHKALRFKAYTLLKFFELHNEGKLDTIIYDEKFIANLPSIYKDILDHFKNYLNGSDNRITIIVSSKVEDSIFKGDTYGVYTDTNYKPGTIVFFKGDDQSDAVAGILSIITDSIPLKDLSYEEVKDYSPITEERFNTNFEIYKDGGFHNRFQVVAPFPIAKEKVTPRVNKNARIRRRLQKSNMKDVQQYAFLYKNELQELTKKLANVHPSQVQVYKDRINQIRQRLLDLQAKDASAYYDALQYIEDDNDRARAILSDPNKDAVAVMESARLLEMNLHILASLPVLNNAIFTADLDRLRQDTVDLYKDYKDKRKLFLREYYKKTFSDAGILARMSSFIDTLGDDLKGTDRFGRYFIEIAASNEPLLQYAGARINNALVSSREEFSNWVHEFEQLRGAFEKEHGIDYYKNFTYDNENDPNRDPDSEIQVFLHDPADIEHPDQISYDVHKFLWDTLISGRESLPPIFGPNGVVEKNFLPALMKGTRGLHKFNPMLWSVSGFFESAFTNRSEIQGDFLIDKETGRHIGTIPIRMYGQNIGIHQRSYDLADVFYAFKAMQSDIRHKNSVIDELMMTTELATELAGNDKKKLRNLKRLNETISSIVYNQPGDIATFKTERRIYNSGEKRKLKEYKKLIDFSAAQIEKLTAERENLMLDARSKGISFDDAAFRVLIDPINGEILEHETRIMNAERFIESLGAHFSLTPTIQAALLWARIKGMAFNLTANFVDGFAGIFANFQMAATGLDWTFEEMNRAQGVAFKYQAMGKRYSKFGKVSKILRIFGLDDHYTELHKGGQAELHRGISKFLNTDSLFWDAKLFDHLKIQPMVIAMLMHETAKDEQGNDIIVNGVPVSWWDCYDDQGNWSVPSSVSGDTFKGDYDTNGVFTKSKYAVNLYNKFSSLNRRTHGNYEQGAPIGALRSFAGQALILFRKWLPQLIKSRVGAAYIDTHTGREVKGIYRSFVFNEEGKFDAKQLKRALTWFFTKGVRGTLKDDFANNVEKDSSKLSLVDKENIMRTAMELSMLTGMSIAYLTFVALAGGGGDDDDENKNPFYKAQFDLNKDGHMSKAEWREYNTEKERISSLGPAGFGTAMYWINILGKTQKELSAAYDPGTLGDILLDKDRTSLLMRTMFEFADIYDYLTKVVFGDEESVYPNVTYRKFEVLGDIFVPEVFKGAMQKEDKGTLKPLKPVSLIPVVSQFFGDNAAPVYLNEKFKGEAVGNVIKNAKEVMEVMWDAIVPQTIPHKAKEPERKKNRIGTVIQVLDGDTYIVDFDGEKMNVRLPGVDTPEIAKDDGTVFGKLMSMVVPDAPYGQEAKEHARVMLEGKEVELEIWKKKDKYGRLLADVYIEGASISDDLMIHGYAHAYGTEGNEVERWKEMETEARNQRKGLWQGNLATDPVNWKHSNFIRNHARAILD